VPGVVEQEPFVVGVLGVGLLRKSVDEVRLEQMIDVLRHRGVGGVVPRVDMRDARTPLRELHRIARAAQLRESIVEVPGNLVRADGLTVLGVLASGLAVLAYRDRAAGSRRAIAIVGEGAVHEIGLGEHDIRVRHPELVGKACVGEVPRVRDVIRQIGDEPLRFRTDP
jgi:hypothetical protein